MELASYQKRLLDHMFPLGFGRLPFTTVVWSEPKKSGKSALAAAVARWWAETQEDYNEIYCCANDFEQAAGRNYMQIRRSVEMAQDPKWCTDPEVVRNARAWKLSRRMMTYENNGTFVQALSGDYAGAAGGNPGMILFSELWGYISEASQRLYGEMTTVPTRRNSFRWVETYAGWEGESTELKRLYDRGVQLPEVPELSDLRSEDGEVEIRADDGMIFFWSHTPRQSWQLGELGERYYREQRNDLRPAEFRRFHKNEWASREGGFIEPSQWDSLDHAGVPLEDLLRTLEPGERVELVLAADASKNRDCTALVGLVISENPERRKVPFLDLCYAMIWAPAYDEELDKVQIDLDETIGKELYRLEADLRVRIQAVAYDPYQLHSIMTTFAKQTKTEVMEFPQTERRVQSDTALRDLIIQKRFRPYIHPVLREHVLNAVAIERPRGLRIDKDATTRHIDGAVALSMVCWASLHHVPRGQRGFLKV